MATRDVDAHNEKQMERAAYLLRRLMLEVAAKNGYGGCVQVRIPIQRGKFGDIRVIREEIH